MNFLRGVMGGQSAGPQHTEAETIQKLCDRVASSTLLDDRRNADRLQKISEKKSSWSKAYVPFFWAFQFISTITH
uniref:USO1 vesicle docking factor n=1 Tax=Mus musculus TaxID=10090 RepID=A0A0J9YUG0_MOUSE